MIQFRGHSGGLISKRGADGLEGVSESTLFNIDEFAQARAIDGGLIERRIKVRALPAMSLLLSY